MAAYATLVSAMHIIDNLQLHPCPPIPLHIKQVESLTQKISFLLEFLQSYNPHRAYSQEADPLEIRIADAAYAAEYAIESHIFDEECAILSHIFDEVKNDGENMSSDGLYKALEKVIQDMASIEEEAKRILQGRVGVPNQLLTNSTLPHSSRSSSILQKRSSSLTPQSSMVGADDVKLQMMDRLTSGCRDRLIIPVAGMGGSGKTTLARTVYEERLIKEHFDICAWATISQEYSIREILAIFLRQLRYAINDNLSDDEVGQILYRNLFGRRYLIVMDDMWSIDAWNGVKRYFPPDDNNGSRIVVTTRLSDLASELSESNNLEMKLLDEADSWELLSKTVFGEEGCPLELEKVGKKIGKGCKGLPLSIVVVGGLLAKSKHTREFWEYVEKNLNAASVNLEDDERCLKILYMSYKQLPLYLKPCFLYMGIFPEDVEIDISRLVIYWVVEGFLKRKSGRSLEEIAKEYLEDLIGRNLVIRNNGNKKFCKIHDLLRDLCRREAKKERFYNNNEAISSLPSMSQARSLTWRARLELSELSMSWLGILKIVRFQPFEDFTENMDQLVNSRFLEIFVGRENFPYSIWRFWNLQTLIVHNYNVVTAPTDFWCMPHIRHVEFFTLRLADPPNDRDDIVLGNLQRLGKVLDFKCSKEVVKKIPNIKKLVFSNGGERDDDMHCLDNLDALTKLKSLDCHFLAMGAINFPQSLKSLVLRSKGSSYCWQDMLDKVGVLPHLRKLTLNNGRFNQGNWETTEGHFRSLRFLSVKWCDGIEIWKTQSSHFPCLESLHLVEVPKLVEIPLDFAGISTLREIDVNCCSDTVVESAKIISQEHENYFGEGALQVRIELASPNSEHDEEEDEHDEEEDD